VLLISFDLHAARTGDAQVRAVADAVRRVHAVKAERAGPERHVLRRLPDATGADDVGAAPVLDGARLLGGLRTAGDGESDEEQHQQEERGEAEAVHRLARQTQKHRVKQMTTVVPRRMSVSAKSLLLTVVPSR